jgi:hypothetical protein
LLSRELVTWSVNPGTQASLAVVEHVPDGGEDGVLDRDDRDDRDDRSGRAAAARIRR